ncbi:MAG: hypothetical protein LBK06_09085 [Planctomycetaceae bacterium]|nr:hypothetical protein [Planctomycetaceae bacterium]
MLQFLSNNLNPIFVKEIRQFTRSNFIVALVNFYILLLVLEFISFLPSIVTRNAMFISFCWWEFGNIVVWTCFFSVIVRTVWSTSVERSNDDLMFCSLLKPSTIVWGKLLTGFVITFILMSIMLPFVMLFNLIGGSDLLYVMLVFVEIFIFVQVMNALAILIAASTFKMPFANFLSLVAISIVFGVLNMFAIKITGRWQHMFVSEKITAITMILISATIAFVLFACAAIAKFSPQNSNRSFYVRLIATVIFITVIGCTSFISPSADKLTFIVPMSFTALVFFFITVVCERDQWTPRIRRSLPQSLVFRFILFPFYTGSACGLVWIGLMMGLLVWSDLLIFSPSLSGITSLLFCDQNGWCLQVTLLFIFVFDFCVTAMLIRSWFFKWIDTSKVWLLAILIFLFVTLCSFIVIGICIPSEDFNFARMDLYKDSWLSILNPIILFNFPISSSRDIFDILIIFDIPINIIFEGVPLYRYYGAIGWAIILLPFLIIWYRQRLKNFSPYNIEESISYEEAKETARNSTVVE